MLCKFCNREFPKLIESHIIPKALFAFGGKSAERVSSKIISYDAEDFPKKAPQGVYDSNLLCFECEGIFQKWDDAAITFFQRDLKNTYPQTLLTTEYTHPIYQYNELKLFFLSIIWRGHHSTQSFYKNVNLGEMHERSIKAALENADAGNSDPYSILIQRFNTNRAAAKIMIAPRLLKKYRDIRLNYYEMVFARFIVWVKVDNRKWPKILEDGIMSPTQPLRVALLNFENSKYRSAMIEAVINNEN